MCKIFSHFSAATGILEYGQTFSVIGYGLFGLLLLSGGMIAYAAIRYHFSQTVISESHTTPSVSDYRTAA
jgi:hypothetical protein